MRPALAARAAHHHGLFTRRDALEAGYTERELRRLLRPSGEWVAVRRGVYAERQHWEGLVGYDAQPALVDRAVQLTAQVPHVLSHDSAARALGLPLVSTGPPLVHITRPGVGGSRTEHGVKHHLSRVAPDIVTVDGLRVTSLARTALDLGREHGFVPGVAAVDHALRAGVGREELEALLEGMRCWPGITGARAAVECGDGGAESPGESMARLLVSELGIGTPETQFPLQLPHGVAWCDLRVGCHVFEFDGRIKYRRAEDGGVSDRPADEVVWDERQRERLICAAGLGVSRLLWEDLWGAARMRAKARLRDEYAVTVARFGQVLPDHLERFAQRMRGRRRAGSPRPM
ncbi:MAG: type IV toxin-antitoxin system AbiEi family antitoxin domain-containing protein [Nocardioides sp.]